MIASETAWERGRLDARLGPSRLLFGRMYEDASVELGSFRPGGRIFCIASAGCTAMKLAPRHDVVAVDINPVQLAYAARRFAGAPGTRGSADHILAFGRAFMPLAGWRSSKVRAFLEFQDTAEQIAFWRRHLNTRRFRAALDALLSVTSLRAFYASRLLDVLPRHFAAVMRARMERCFSLHPNRTNPYARALLLGELPNGTPPRECRAIRLVHSDAAAYLERAPAGSFDGFSLSNILDGADEAYARRLSAAVKRAAGPGAVVVSRSFAEALDDQTANRAADDRTMLWGVVDVRPAAALEGVRGVPARQREARRPLREAPAAGQLSSIVTRTKFPALPEQAWAVLMFYEQIKKRPPLALRLLLPTPIRAEGRKSEVGDEATCLYESGHMLKRVTQIVRGRRLEFEVVEQRLAVGGGIRLAGGSYMLTGLPDGRTEIALSTRYASPMRPRWLWRPVEAALCHMFHRHILGAMRQSASRA